MTSPRPCRRCWGSARNASGSAFMPGQSWSNSSPGPGRSKEWSGRCCGRPGPDRIYWYRAARVAADMDSMLRISVVLPTLNRPEAIYNLLRHLEHQTLRPFEIVVVDQSDAADPRVAAYAAEHPLVRLHRIPVKGLPNARNVGVGLAKGDAILFLDDDSIPDADLVRFHAEAYADPAVAGAGGQVRGGYDAVEGAIG